MLISIWSACDQIEGVFEGELPLLASQATIQSLWQDGKITLWGTRRHHAKLEPITETSTANTMAEISSTTITSIRVKPLRLLFVIVEASLSCRDCRQAVRCSAEVTTRGGGSTTAVLTSGQTADTLTRAA